jgi:RimJ/RimL family protein N-acetyltransferase
MAAHLNATPGGEPIRIDSPVLVTDHLVMRAPCDDDIPDLIALADNVKVAEMLRRMPHPYGEDDARYFLDTIVRGNETAAVYAVTLAESGTFIGCAGLEELGSGLELGYWLGEPYWGRGYAGEAAGALVDLAFRATAVDRLFVSCRIANPASRRIIEKCGFRFSDHGVMESLVAGKVAVEHYALDRADWLQRLSAETAE